MKGLTILFLVAFIMAAGFSQDARAQVSVVVPNSLTDVEGNAVNLFPINCGAVFDTQRYQQLYSASQFGFGGTITAIKFRLDESRTSAFGPSVIENLQIDTSITQVAPPNASNIFADNLGPVVQTVFNGDLSVSAPECNTTPCPFDIIVPLQSPFVYNPAQGNLIVDWRLDPCLDLGNPTFDATTTPVMGVQRIFNSNVDSPNGDNLNSNLGLVTEFVIINAGRVTPIPTLSAWAAAVAVLGFGMGGVIALRKRAKA